MFKFNHSMLQRFLEKTTVVLLSLLQVFVLFVGQLVYASFDSVEVSLYFSLRSVCWFSFLTVG